MSPACPLVVTFPNGEQLSTVFSILFASTIGRMLSSLALWLLEKGSKVGLLDQLVGSSSVGSALMAQLSAGMRRGLSAHLTGIALLLLWLLSPLGSQAVLQISVLVDDKVPSNHTFSYLNVSNWDNIPGASSDGQLMLIAPNALLNAVLISPSDSKDKSQDLWAHVKIPFLSSLPANSTDPDGWRQVANISADDYSSLVGIPIGFLPTSTDQFTTVPLQSWYWNLDCDRWDNSTAYSTLSRNYSSNSTQGGRSQNFVWPALSIFYNDTTIAGNRTLGNRATSGCKVSVPSNKTVIYCPELGVRTIGIRLLGLDPTYSTCRITTEYVETEISCSGRTCSASRMRKSQEVHPPPEWTALDVFTGSSVPGYTVPSLWFNSFANAIAGRQGGSGGSNALTGYIADPEAPFEGNGGNSKASIYSVSDALVTSRLAQVLNSYWIATVGRQLVMSTDSRFNDSANSTSFAFVSGGRVPTTNMTGTTSGTIGSVQQKLHCNTAWLFAFTAVTVIALLVSVAGYVLVVLAQGPRLDMNISTILRDSWYSHPLQGGSYLDDSERSRLLRDLTVRIGDVAPDQNVGYIAVSTVDDGRIIGQIRKDRVYY